MSRRISPDDLTEEEGRALWTYLENRVAQQSLNEAAAKLGTESVEERIRLIREGTSEEHVARAREWLKTAEAAVELGRLQEPVAFLVRMMAIERIHNDRLTRKEYDSELADVKERMNRVQEEAGLSPGHFWRIGEGPAEWETLNQEYDAICERLMVRALREFGLSDEAQLLESSPDEFHRKREVARRAMFDGISNVERLAMLQSQFAKEAEASAFVGAYHAAAAMVGAAMEAAILARCLDRVDETRDARLRLNPPIRSRSNNPREWKFAELCRVADEAGWLPIFALGEDGLAGKELVTLVRELRNMIHPERQLCLLQADRKYGAMVVRSQYEDARAAYELLRRHLANN